jgi:hypothetical protein
MIALLVLVVTVVAVAGCGGSGTSSKTSAPGVGDVVNNAKNQANGAVREANLRMIDSAIQQYYASTGSWPTDVSQLSQYFSGGLPTDPGKGTYYITTENGQAKAAVR